MSLGRFDSLVGYYVQVEAFVMIQACPTLIFQCSLLLNNGIIRAILIIMGSILMVRVIDEKKNRHPFNDCIYKESDD